MTGKNRVKKWLSIGAVSCAGLLIASGCGSDADTAASESAIGDYVGIDFFGDFDSETVQQDFAAQQREAEELIAACMAEQGFEYTPTDNGQIVGFGDDEGLEWGGEEWTAKYGFGVSTLHFGQSEVGPELVGHDDSFMAAGEEFVDPNQEYLDTLDEAGRDAYYAALFGDDFQTGFDGPTEVDGAAIEDAEGFFEPSGCQGEAWNDNSSDFAFYEEFDSELDQLMTDVEADPKILAKFDEVRECTTKAGYELPSAWPEGSSDDGIYQKEIQEIEAIVGTAEDQFADVDFEAMSEEELEAMFSSGPPARDFSPDATKLLADLQSKEIGTAVAAFDCGGGQRDMFDLFREVLRGYEEQFIESNKDKLDAYNASKGSTE